MAYRFNAEKFERDKAEREAARAALAWAEMDAMPASVGFCYFFGGDEGPIKIGFSRDVAGRINTLKSNTGPIRTRLLAKINGGREREAHYHHRFREYRLGHEWFTRCPEIEAEIARLNSPRSNCIGEQHG